MAAVGRAFIGYCFLVFAMRIAGRRPGKQLTPMEFVLVFFCGGLTLTTMVSDEHSVTNALCQIMTIALTHWIIAWLRPISPTFGRMVDGTPLQLLSRGRLHKEVMQKTRMEEEDLLAMTRDKGLLSLEKVQYAFLERNGEISVIPKSEKD